MNSLLDVCEIWDLAIPTGSSHSQLYSLEPQGVGTPYIESLTSYIGRLADAHSVSVKTLILSELSPLLKRRYLSNPNIKGLGSFWKRCASTVNASGNLARDFAQALESLTLRKNLCSLTLIPWSSVFAQKGQIRTIRAWCPNCFTDWESASEPLYEPLLWYVQSVSLCPRHQTRLITQCPHGDCKAILPVITWNFRPGYCSKCSRWLGTVIDSCNTSKTSFETEEWEWQLWTGKKAGELLAHNADLAKVPHLSNVPALITACLELPEIVSLGKFAKLVQLSRCTLRMWKRSAQKPQLAALMRLCYCSDTSMFEMLTLPPKIFTLGTLKSRPLPVSLGKYERINDRIRLNKSAIRQALENVLTGEEQPPPSLDAVAKRLKRNDKILRDYFPDLCKAISIKYMNYRHEQSKLKVQSVKEAMRQEILKIYARGEYPAHTKVARNLSKSHSIGYDVAHKFWREMLEELGLRS